MKPTYFSVTILVVVCLFTSNMKFKAQSYPKIAPSDDCSLLVSFLRTDTVFVVFPDLIDFNLTLNNCVKSCNLNKAPVLVYKHESEIGKREQRQHLFFFGTFSDFKRDEFLKIPIQKDTNGFRFHGKRFTSPENAFFYVNKSCTRMYFCKNSTHDQLNPFLMGVGAYPLHIFADNQVLITGVYM